MMSRLRFPLFRLRLWALSFLGGMSVGMSWLVRKGATLDPPDALHPQAFYLGWGLEFRSWLWLGAGVVALACALVASRRAQNLGFVVLTIFPIQRALAWAWESLMAATHGHWEDATSTLIITVFWACLVGVVWSAQCIPTTVGGRVTRE